MKKITALLLTTLLSTTMCLPAAATPAPSEGEPVRVESVTEIPIDSAYISITDKDRLVLTIYGDETEGYLLNEKGERVVEDPFPVIYHTDTEDFTPIYSVRKDGSLNGLAIMDKNGNFLSDYQYGVVNHLSEKWIVAFVGEELEDDGAPADYYDDIAWSEGRRIVSADVYYEGQYIGTLSRDEAASPNFIYAFGSFLVTQSSVTGVYYCFDSSLNKVNELHTYEYEDGGTWYFDEYYTEDDENYFHVSGVPVFAPECTLSAEDVIEAYNVNLDGQIVDLQGNVVSDLPYEVYSVGPMRNGFMSITAGDDWKEGLLNVNMEEFLAPEYDWIGGDWYIDGQMVNGYARVRKDNKFAYIREDGEMTLPFRYSNNNTQAELGLMTVLTDLDGYYRVVSATAGLLDGVYSEVALYIYDYSCPILQVRDMDGKWGIIDYLGNTIVPFEYEEEYDIDLRGDGSLVKGIKGDTAYIYDLTWDFGTEEAARLAAEAAKANTPEPVNPIGGEEMDDALSMKLTDLLSLILIAQGDWAMETGDILYFTEEEDGMHFLLTDSDGIPSQGTAYVKETEDNFLLVMEWDDGSRAEYGLAFQDLLLYMLDGSDSSILSPAE